MLGEEGGKRECQEKAILQTVSSISKSSEAREKLKHRHTCEPSVWIKDGFPEGSDGN